MGAAINVVALYLAGLTPPRSRSTATPASTARSKNGVRTTYAPARRGPVAGDLPLTSQQTRVALLAARGLSNREIGASLFLSPKTVERHLSSVFRKRGFRSRTELAASFARSPGW
jgi:DNA-binding NarL/FixJ family response regulator